MKKNTLILMLAAALFAMSSCTQPSDLTTVSGTWARTGAGEVSLFRIVSGRLEKMADYQVRDSSRFFFAFAPTTEGYYVIGTGNPAVRQGKYTFYFKPGDRLNVSLNDSSYTLTGNNTAENKAMAAWHDHLLPLERNAFNLSSRVTYVEFFPLLEEKTAQEYTAAGTGNSAFDRSFAGFRKFDLLHCALNFILSPRSAHPEGADFPDFYRAVKIAELTATADMLSYPYELLTSAAYIEGRLSNPQLNNPDSLIAAVVSDTLKGELAMRRLTQTRDYVVFESLKEKYNKLVITDDQQQRLQKQTDLVMAIHNESGIGKPAINFTHKDRNGKSVSLADFKGKVVYVDVWATWCAPCRKELPHLKALEEKFRNNKDIVFIGVSVDEAKDQQKWKDFLDKEQLPGVQLFGGAGWNSDIAKFYQIKAIPRFMLFDKKGNVVSVDAPRPSSTDIASLLQKLTLMK